MRKSSWAMGARRGRLSAPWLRFHGGGAADVYIIIRVRASRCGESALNPPTSPPIPRQRPSPAPAAQTHPSRAFSPPPSRTLPLPRPATMHARRLRHAFPAEDLRSPPHSDAPCPSTFSLPPRPDAHPQAARCIPRRPHNTFPAEDLHPPQHNDTPSPSTFSLPPLPDARPQAARCTPADPTTHSSPKAVTRPRTATRSSRTLSHPLPAPTHTRRLRRRTPTDPTTHSPPKTFARPRTATPPSPSVPLRAQKNGTAQCMCDAECLGRPSLRSVIGVGEPRAVRRRCGALAWRVGLRPQPWALRSRRCGRVLRA